MCIRDRLDVVGEEGRQAAQLRVAEGVLGHVLVGVLGDDGAVLVVEDVYKRQV